MLSYLSNFTSFAAGSQHLPSRAHFLTSSEAWRMSASCSSNSRAARFIPAPPLFRLARRVRILGAREGEQALDFFAVAAAVSHVPELHQGHGAGDEQAKHDHHGVDREA